jgi:hypothetical protein
MCLGLFYDKKVKQRNRAMNEKKIECLIVINDEDTLLKYLFRITGKSKKILISDNLFFIGGKMKNLKDLKVTLKRNNIEKKLGIDKVIVIRLTSSDLVECMKGGDITLLKRYK